MFFNELSGSRFVSLRSEAATTNQPAAVQNVFFLHTRCDFEKLQSASALLIKLSYAASIFYYARSSRELNMSASDRAQPKHTEYLLLLHSLSVFVLLLQTSVPAGSHTDDESLQFNYEM